jgi:hypothetical protein
MEKRYQVFVSSTYTDLKEERSLVLQTLMQMDCIPSGMELFPAMDEEQMNFIKKVIDDCDYYILIIGGRYGSVTAEGVSYTEMEYDYAVSKGIKVIALLHGEPGKLPVEKSEMNESARQKLEDFRAKVSDKRLVNFWKDASQIPGLIALNLSKTIKTYPAIGWVRANQVPSGEVYAELMELKRTNVEMEARLKAQSNSKNVSDEMVVGPYSFDRNGFSYEATSKLFSVLYYRAWVGDYEISGDVLLLRFGLRFVDWSWGMNYKDFEATQAKYERQPFNSTIKEVRNTPVSHPTYEDGTIPYHLFVLGLVERQDRGDDPEDTTPWFRLNELGLEMFRLISTASIEDAIY